MIFESLWRHRQPPITRWFSFKTPVPIEGMIFESLWRHRQPPITRWFSFKTPVPIEGMIFESLWRHRQPPITRWFSFKTPVPIEGMIFEFPDFNSLSPVKVSNFAAKRRNYSLNSFPPFPNWEGGRGLGLQQDYRKFEKMELHFAIILSPNLTAFDST